FCSAPARSSAPGAPPATPGLHLLGPLRSPAVLLLVCLSLALGTCFGFLDVALPAFTREEGHPGLAGVLAALIAVGSITGGLVAGRRAWRRSLGTRPTGFLLALAGPPPPPAPAPSVRPH